MSPYAMPSTVISGHCACGKVAWSSISAPEHLDFCYCSTCQQASGAPFASWIGIAKSSMKWTGETSTWRPTIGDGNKIVSTRTFCPECGSCMAIQYDFYPDKTHLAAGSVNEGASTIPNLCMHMWLKKAPNWYRIPKDGVPRYEEFPEDFKKAWARHQKSQE